MITDKGQNMENMDAFVTVRFRFNNICNEDDLKNCNMSLSDMVKYLIREEGICGVIDDEDYEIIDVEKVLN